MKNEPVAWKVTETDDEGSFTTFTEVEPVWTDNAIPLYTHPAKTLTDEEIWNIWDDYKNFTDANGEYSEVDKELIFARAILRKAQEK